MMKGQHSWWVLAVVVLSPWSAQAQERSVFSSQTLERPGPLSEVVAAVNIPAEWGTLKNALPETPPHRRQPTGGLAHVFHSQGGATMSEQSLPASP